MSAVKLGFPGADKSCLVWRETEGIYSMKKRPSYLAMVNYPATVRVSKDGAGMIDSWFNDRGRYSSVDVYAENALGQCFGMFTLNITCMGYLQALLNKEDAWSADEHGKLWTHVERQYFSYSPEDNAFSRNKTCDQCSFCMSYRDQKCDASSPITKFGAELLVGTASGADETFEFAQIDAAFNYCSKLVLVIDGDVEQTKFVLHLLVEPHSKSFVGAESSPGKEKKHQSSGNNTGGASTQAGADNL